MGSYMSSEPPIVPWPVLHAEVTMLGEEFEGDIASETAESTNPSYDRCRKNPGHLDMIPLEEFTLDHLPAPWRDQTLFETIYTLARNVAKIQVSYISHRRPENYAFGKLRGKFVKTVGTGYVFLRGDDLKKPCMDCPLKNCDRPKPHQVTPFFEVQTATHVVFDDFEAQETVLEFFYEFETDTSNVVIANGVKVLTSTKQHDQCTLICVSHDLALFEKILLAPFTLRRPPATYLPPPPSPPGEMKSPLVLVISHPHGHTKRISFEEWKGFRHKKDLKHPESTTVKTKEWVELIESVAPSWMEEGLYLNGTYVSPDHILSMKQKAEVYPDSTIDQWSEPADASTLSLAFITYTAMTCPGSSGSSVFVFFEREGGGWDWGMITTHYRHFKGELNASGSVSIRLKCSDHVAKAMTSLKDEGAKKSP